VRINEPPTDDIQSGSGDSLGTEKRGAAALKKAAQHYASPTGWYSRPCGPGM